MADVHQHALLVVLLVAAIAPLFNELPVRLRLPLVVLELLFGVTVGRRCSIWWATRAC